MLNLNNDFFGFAGIWSYNEDTFSRLDLFLAPPADDLLYEIFQVIGVDDNALDSDRKLLQQIL